MTQPPLNQRKRNIFSHESTTETVLESVDVMMCRRKPSFSGDLLECAEDAAAIQRADAIAARKYVIAGCRTLAAAELQPSNERAALVKQVAAAAFERLKICFAAFPTSDANCVLGEIDIRDAQVDRSGERERR